MNKANTTLLACLLTPVLALTGCDSDDEGDSGSGGGGTEAAESDVSGSGSGGGGEGGSANNVEACENYIQAASCGDIDLGMYLDCSLYTNTPCDIADYFDCLADNLVCTDGVPDVSGWTSCAELATCA